MGQPTAMVDMDVGQDQGPDLVDREIDLRLPPPLPLTQTAVDQDRVIIVNYQLVTGARSPAGDLRGG